jgi:hypothetical protein
LTAFARIFASCCVACLSLAEREVNLRVMIAPATIATDAVTRGVLVPFQVGDDLPDGTVVDYIAELMGDERVFSQMKGRAAARGGRVVGELKFGAPAASAKVRLSAHASALNRQGSAVATVNVPTQDRESCGGMVFDQARARRGMRQFSRDAPVVISAVVWAQGLDGTVAPLRFGLGAVGAPPQKFWPVQLGIPLRGGLWRVAFTLRSPIPAGDWEIKVLRGDRLLGEGCAAQFSTY